VNSTGQLLEHLFRREAGRMVAHLARLLGPSRLDVAEESVQTAMVRALETWPFHGTPGNPAAWLFRVARNAALDAVRHSHMAGQKIAALAAGLAQSNAFQPGDAGFEEQLRDDELRMIFMCCHPALAREASVALSLKTVGGFSTREIARAFLADERAVAQRLVRAKRQIRDEHLTLDMPATRELAARLDAALEVIYFMFNEGYGAQSGETLIRQDLCYEALRLGRLVASAITTPRVHALVALMALQAARLAARVDELGDLVLLEQQDRARWDDRLIALGFHHFDLSMADDDVSEYHIQAAIAATHARATDASSVDWPLILSLYDDLLSKNPSPVVALNRAVAIAKVHGPAAGLAAVAPLERDRHMRRYHLLLAVRAQLLFDLGRRTQAAEAFRAALDCECSEPERRFLARKLQLCEPVSHPAT
jgi:RNA polymerase sigma-70 factor, ECF subfamily